MGPKTLRKLIQYVKDKQPGKIYIAVGSGGAKTPDVIISFTQLKQHEEATVTASIKNIAMGWLPAEIHGYPKKIQGYMKTYMDL